MGILIGIVLLAVLAPVIIGIVIPLILCVVTLPLQLLGIINEEEKK